MSKTSSTALISLLMLSLLFGGKYVLSRKPHTPMQPQQAGAAVVLGAQTKRENCLVKGSLPDTMCTPGAVFTTATKEIICVPGYSKTVRNVSTQTKNAVYKAYGVASHPSGTYEIDHLVSLQLGGSNDIANLWPEAADPIPGFHEKDVVENMIHARICSGQIPLASAQQQIAANWLQLYSAN